MPLDYAGKTLRGRPFKPGEDGAVIMAVAMASSLVAVATQTGVGTAVAACDRQSI